LRVKNGVPILKEGKKKEKKGSGMPCGFYNFFLPTETQGGKVRKAAIWADVLKRKKKRRGGGHIFRLCKEVNQTKGRGKGERTTKIIHILIEVEGGERGNEKR